MLRVTNSDLAQHFQPCPLTNPNPCIQLFLKVHTLNQVIPLKNHLLHLKLASMIQQFKHMFNILVQVTILIQNMNSRSIIIQLCRNLKSYSKPIQGQVFPTLSLNAYIITILKLK